MGQQAEPFPWSSLSLPPLCGRLRGCRRRGHFRRFPETGCGAKRRHGHKHTHACVILTLRGRKG